LTLDGSGLAQLSFLEKVACPLFYVPFFKNELDIRYSYVMLNKKKRGIMESPIWGNGLFKKKNKEGNIFTTLKKVPIFSDLTPKELAEVEKIVHQRRYKKNETIIHAGDPGLGMYIIINGSVEIVEEDEKAGKRTLAKLSDGSFFGDMALLDEDPRSASAIALVDSDIMGFFRPDFLDLIYRKPKLGIKVLLALARVIGERLRHTNELLVKIQERKDTPRNG